MILSTKLAGLGHAAFLFMTTARDRVSYIYPNVNSAGAGLLLSETFTANGLNLSEGGYNMSVCNFIFFYAFLLAFNSKLDLKFFSFLLFTFPSFLDRTAKSKEQLLCCSSFSCGCY